MLELVGALMRRTVDNWGNNSREGFADMFDRNTKCGTPGGVGHARKPPRYLTDGAELVTAVAGVGELRNTCRLEKP